MEIAALDLALRAVGDRHSAQVVAPSTDGLVSYWPMNEGEGSTFYDLSPNRRDITYTNGVTIQWTYDDTNKCVE